MVCPLIELSGYYIHVRVNYLQACHITKVTHLGLYYKDYCRYLDTSIVLVPPYCVVTNAQTLFLFYQFIILSDSGKSYLID